MIHTDMTRRFPLRLRSVVARRLRRCAPLLAALSLAACTDYPYPTTPPTDLTEQINEIYFAQKLQEGPQSNLVRPTVVSLCYGPAIDDTAELFDSALRACPGDYQRLIYYGQDTLGAPCALVQPYRHTFLCVNLESRTLVPPIPNEGRVVRP